MIRISRSLGTALSLVLVLVATPVSSDTASQQPITESTSSGLFTFSREERAIRVAAVFTSSDSAVVPTLVRFLDQDDNLLKQVQGDLSEGNAVVVELTRADVAGRGDLLVRVEVLHILPGLQLDGYPIMVLTQPIGSTGSPRSPIPWPGGRCADPLNKKGEPIDSGRLKCNFPIPAEF